MSWLVIRLPFETGYKNFPKAAARKGGGAPLLYYDRPERDLRAMVQASIRAIWGDRPPLVGDVEVVYYFGVPVPKSWSKKDRAAALAGHIKPNVKPDLTNRLYWLENRLKGIVFADDALVVDLSAKARYEEVAYTEVFVRTDSGSQQNEQ